MPSPQPETVDAEIVEDQPSQELTLATIRVTPEQAAEAVANIRAVVNSVLEEGRDFMTIPGTKKPSLLKPGAEALQRFFGLGSELGNVETGTLESGSFYAKVRCSIKNRDGMILGESEGWADQDESKWKKAPRNTVISMATKRAYVAAIRTATGTSDFFTDSMEDHSQQSAPAAKPLVEDRMPSDDEKLLLAGLYAQKHPAGVTLAEAMEWVASYKSKADSRNWVAIQVLGLMMRPDPMPAEAMPKDDTVPIVIPGQTEIPVDDDSDAPPF